MNADIVLLGLMHMRKISHVQMASAVQVNRMQTVERGLGSPDVKA